MRIEAARCSELPAEEWALLEAIAEAEFSQYALVRETQWAPPDWCYRCFEGDQLAAFHNIVLRTVSVDGQALRVAGLNNMITLPSYRGRGVASALLSETQPQWFRELGAECGLLLCADELVPFYSKLTWRRLDARVSYAQSTGARDWVANCMVLEPDNVVRLPRHVDLCGLPW